MSEPQKVYRYAQSYYSGPIHLSKIYSRLSTVKALGLRDNVTIVEYEMVEVRRFPASELGSSK